MRGKPLSRATAPTGAGRTPSTTAPAGRRSCTRSTRRAERAVHRPGSRSPARTSSLAARLRLVDGRQDRSSVRAAAAARCSRLAAGSIRRAAGAADLARVDRRCRLAIRIDSSMPPAARSAPRCAPPRPDRPPRSRRCYRHHWPRAYRAAYLVVHDAAAAEDIAQEAFLAAVRNLDRFDRRRPFGPWLHRIVVNRAIDWARARALRAEVELADVAGRAGRAAVRARRRRCGALARAAAGAARSDRAALPARVHARRDRGAARPAARHRQLAPAPRPRRARRGWRRSGERATLAALARGPVPDEAEARGARWPVVRAAFAEREPRRRAAAAARPRVARRGRRAVGAARSARRAARCSARSATAIGVEHAAAGALLAARAGAAARRRRRRAPGSSREDGSKRLLGAYRDASWSPFGLFVVAARGEQLVALEPDGSVRWTLARPAVAFPRWARQRDRHPDRLPHRHAAARRRRRRHRRRRPRAAAGRAGRAGLAAGGAGATAARLRRHARPRARATRPAARSLGSRRRPARCRRGSRGRATAGGCSRSPRQAARLRPRRPGRRARRAAGRRTRGGRRVPARRRTRSRSCAGRAAPRPTPAARLGPRALPAPGALSQVVAVARRPLAAGRLAGRRPVGVRPHGRRPDRGGREHRGAARRRVPVGRRLVLRA